MNLGVTLADHDMTCKGGPNPKIPRLRRLFGRYLQLACGLLYGSALLRPGIADGGRVHARARPCSSAETI